MIKIKDAIIVIMPTKLTMKITVIIIQMAIKTISMKKKFQNKCGHIRTVAKAVIPSTIYT